MKDDRTRRGMPLDAVHLSTFAAVVSEGSFDAAARRLHVTASAVSQRVKALEAAVGQVLVRRARPCRATTAGQPLLRLAGQIALLEREAIAAAGGPVAGDGAWTRAAIVVNADSLSTWFLPALAGLPPALRIAFDLHVEDQDHTADLLRDGSAMAAVTAQQTVVQGCRVSRLGAMRYLAVATPALVRRYLPAGTSPGALAETPVIVFNRKDQLQHRFLRRMTRRQLDPPVHYVPSAGGFTEAVRLGLGWGMLPEQIARADLAAGRCVELDPGRHLDVPLYWQHWRLDSSVLDALTAAVRSAASAALR